MREQSHNQVRVPSAEGLSEGGRSGGGVRPAEKRGSERLVLESAHRRRHGSSVWCEDSEASQRRV